MAIKPRRIMSSQDNWKTNLIERSRKDPVWWIENVLGTTLWSKQKELCESVRDHERTACPACFDDQTEIFTPTGWKLFSELKEGEEVAIQKSEKTLFGNTCQQDGNLVFEVPKKIHKYDYEDELLLCQTKMLDFMVTPNHRCKVKGDQIGSKYQMKYAGDIYRSAYWHFDRKVRWEGVDSRPEYTEDHYRFFGFWCADGSLESNRRGIRIGQKTKVAYLDDLIPKVYPDIKKHRYEYDCDPKYGGKNVVFCFSDKSLCDQYIEDFSERKSTRTLPLWLKNAPPKKLLAFLEGFFEADGWDWHNDKKPSCSRIYYEGLAHDLQEIAMKAGFVANLRYNDTGIRTSKGFNQGLEVKFWELSLLTEMGREPRPGKTSWSKVPYQGKVYCVETSTGIILVRRNGLYHWSGNSFGVGKCVAWEDSIVLSNGTRAKANHLIGKQFQILAFDEKTGEQVPTMAFASDNDIHAVYKIVTKSGREIIRTGNHPLYACDIIKKNTTLYPENIGFKAIENLDISLNAVAVPIKLNIDNSEYNISDDEIKLLGYLLGDGGTTIGVGFTQVESVTKDEFREIISRMGCKCVDRDDLSLVVTAVSEKKQAQQNHTNYVLKLVKDWGLIGKKAVDKFFPDFVWSFSDRQLALLLNRLWSCDGWACVTEDVKYNNPQIDITFASERMTRDVQHAMIRLGIYGFYSTGQLIKNNKVYHSYTWQVRRATEIIKFAENIGIYGKEEQLKRVYDFSKAKEHLLTNSPQWVFRGLPEGYIWEKIKSIEYVGHQRTVAISVPIYHTYLTEFVEHNTFIAASLALWFLYNHKPGKVISTAPTFRQVRDLLWTEIRNMHQRAKMPLGGECLQLALKLNDEQFAIGFSTDANNIDMFTGYHSPNMFVIFDQAAGLPPMFWEAAEGLMTSANCRWLAISNTAISDSEFANICIPERKTRFGTWNIIKVCADDSPNVVAKRNIFPGLISYDWVNKRKLAWGRDDPLYKIFILAEFVMSSQMVVIPGHFIQEAFDSEGIMNDEIEVGLDVARSGLDSTVWFARSGTCGFYIRRHTGNSTMEVVGHTIELLRWLEETYDKPVVSVKVDVIGVGAGVYDRLVELNYPCIPVNNSEVKIVIDQERYLNVRAETAWGLRFRFEHQSIGLKLVSECDLELSEYLQSDLQVQKYKISSNGKIQLLSKDDIRKELGRSPDYYDACVMAFQTPGGGLPEIEYVSESALKNKQAIMSEEEWNSFLGIDFNLLDSSFK